VSLLPAASGVTHQRISRQVSHSHPVACLEQVRRSSHIQQRWLALRSASCGAFGVDRRRPPGRTDPATLHARLTAAPRGATSQEGAAHVHITRALVVTLTALVEQIAILSHQIGEQLAAHADAHIFTSLPRAGTVRAARLLAEIGDCRARFPTPEASMCLAGVAPSTRQSGKMCSVGFRWGCDKQLRDAVCDFANDSRHANPWAADLYNRARARNHTHQHAVRILARAWLYVIWHCWQNSTAYNPDHHRALQPLPQSAA
jgi:transposase